eukprot:TRINITY_DN3922_c0_g1_i1.p1 TRINITY_DN3922_c0_g1~~TRINITY_DN3922_c0_g1_i1.p1  ORF type:complete len:196 (+),score=81.18 TRINITY_DN3922_c0_g1_i1:54-641(+)
MSGAAGKKEEERAEMVKEEQMLLALYEAADVKPELAEDYEAALASFEKEIKRKVPPEYRALLKYNHCNTPFPFPSLGSEELEQQYSYNAQQQVALYRICGLIPFGQIDYDFCWRALDSQTGQILLADLECDEYEVVASSIASYLEFLTTLVKDHKAGKCEGSLSNALFAARDPNKTHIRGAVLRALRQCRDGDED